MLIYVYIIKYHNQNNNHIHHLKTPSATLYLLNSLYTSPPGNLSLLSVTTY